VRQSFSPTSLPQVIATMASRRQLGRSGIYHTHQP
jgi:hypothetical protein